MIEYSIHIPLYTERDMAGDQKALAILMQSSAVLDYKSIKTAIKKLKSAKNIHHVSCVPTTADEMYISLNYAKQTYD